MLKVCPPHALGLSEADVSGTKAPGPYSPPADLEGEQLYVPPCCLRG
jgi:hypothetical protein